MNSEWRCRIRRLIAPGLALFLAACYEGEPEGFREVVIANRHDVSALSIDGEVPVIETGAGISLRALAEIPGGTLDLSHEVSWLSSDETVFSVDHLGRVSALRNGTAQLSARLAGLVASVTITASNAALQTITVTGDAAVDECGLGDYSATGHYEDGTDRDLTTLVTWSVNDLTVARMGTLAGEYQRLVSQQAGTTGVIASRGAIGSAPFTVTIADNLDDIQITPATPGQLQPGSTLSFAATGRWGTRQSDVSRAAAWSVSNDDTTTAAIAEINSGDAAPGRLVAVRGGIGRVLAACGGRQHEVPLTVVFLESLSITNTRPIELATGASVLLALEGRYSDGSTKPLNESADWSVSSVSGTPVTVSNAEGSRGRVTAGDAAGNSTVTATVDGESVAVSVVVNE